MNIYFLLYFCNVLFVYQYQEFIDEVEEEYELPKVEAYKNAMSKAIINHSCVYCGAGFAQANNLLRHMQTHEHTEDISQ